MYYDASINILDSIDKVTDPNYLIDSANKSLRKKSNRRLRNLITRVKLLRSAGDTVNNLRVGLVDIDKKSDNKFKISLRKIGLSKKLANAGIKIKKKVRDIRRLAALTTVIPGVPQVAAIPLLAPELLNKDVHKIIKGEDTNSTKQNKIRKSK